MPRYSTKATKKLMPKVAIDHDAHKRLKVHCAKTGERMATAATRAIVEYLRRVKK